MKSTKKSPDPKSTNPGSTGKVISCKFKLPTCTIWLRRSLKRLFKEFVSGFKSPKLKGDMKKKWEGIQKQKWISQVKEESENATKEMELLFIVSKRKSKVGNESFPPTKWSIRNAPGVKENKE